MTLIAAFKVGNIPVLIGDVLLSREEYEDDLQKPPISLPTVGDSHEVFPPGSGFILSDVTQKVNVIDRNLVVAWAGSHIAAKTIILELRKRNQVEQFNRQSIAHFFEEAKDWLASLAVAFIGFIVNSEGVEAFNYSFNGAMCRKFNSPRFGDVLAYGSGASDLEELVLKSTRPVSKATKGLSDFDNAIIESLTLCSFLFGDEMATSRSLYQFYGGTYEICIYSEFGFEKLDDITYLFWLFHNDSKDGFLRLITKGFKVTYSDDIALISAFELQDLGELYIEEYADKVQSNLTSEKIYYVLPIDKTIQENQRIELKGLNSLINCSFVFNTLGDLHPACVPTKVSDIHKNRVRFVFGDDNQPVLEVDKSFLEFLVKAGYAATNM